MADQQLLFDYVDLNDIDPNFSPIPEEMYTLKILKAEKKDFNYKQGAKAGQAGQMLKFHLAVADHPEHSGRRLFPSLFPSNFTFRALRRLADATGIQQEPGTGIEQWLADLSEVQPMFKAKVTFLTKRVKNADGTWSTEVVLNDAGNPSDNDVDWSEIQPA